MTKQFLTMAVALTLGLAPLAATAQGCDHEKIKMSCAQGSIWDPEKQSCVPLAS